MSWFEEWFDSPLYEKLYSYRNEKEASRLADLIEKKIPKKKYPQILDLGCGRGRHSITLAERGYSVTGLDLSEEAVQKAYNLASQKDLVNITFIQGDMREPLNKKFDAILNLFTTFGYFFDDSENIRVLNNMHSMLREGGLVMIDYLNAGLVKKSIVPEEFGSFREFDFRIIRKIKNGMVYKNITSTGPDLDKPVQYQERVKLYDLAWFKKHLADNGFTVESVLGDYSGNDFDPETSPRLILIGRKADV